MVILTGQLDDRTRQKERLNERRERAIQRIKDAESPESIELAHQQLQEIDLEERINVLRQELREMRERHRSRRRELRGEWKRPATGPEERQKRRERYEKYRKHEQDTMKLIARIIERYDQEEGVRVISYTEIATALNEEFDHKTIYNGKWTNASIKKIIEKNNRRLNHRRIGHEDDKQKAANDKRARMFDEYALVFREKYLPLIDRTQNPFAIAKKLKELQVPTRKEYEKNPTEPGKGRWGNMTVKRLLQQIDKIEFAMKFMNKELPKLDTSRSYETIAEDLNRLEIPDHEGVTGKWEGKSVRELLKRIQLLPDVPPLFRIVS